MANSSQTKAMAKVIAASTLRFKKNVTIHNVEVRNYKAVIDNAPKDYEKMYLVFAVTDNDDHDFLNMQKVLMLGKKDDPAYAKLVNAKPGEKGTLTFSVSEQITDESVDEKTGFVGTGSHVVSLKVEDWEKE